MNLEARVNGFYNINNNVSKIRIYTTKIEAKDRLGKRASVVQSNVSSKGTDLD